MKTFKEFLNEEKDSAYDEFFKKALKKFGVSEPDELEGDKEKEFYNYIDKNWKSGKEEKTDEGEDEQDDDDDEEEEEGDKE